jgi:hypothetical protein
MNMAKRAESCLLLRFQLASLFVVCWSLQHAKMAVHSRVLETAVVVGACSGMPRLMFDCIGVCSFVSRMGGVVGMLMFCLVSSSIGLCVVCEVDNDWVNLRLSRARRLRRVPILRRVRTFLLTFSSRTCCGFLGGSGKWCAGRKEVSNNP